MIEFNELYSLLKGHKVIISSCEAAEHGNNEGCLCSLRGTIQTVDKLYDSIFVGTPSWHLADSNKRARLSEMILIKDV